MSLGAARSGPMTRRIEVLDVLRGVAIMGTLGHPPAVLPVATLLTLRGTRVDRVSTMAVRQFPVIVAWDARDELSVTYVPALDHLSTYGETRQAALDHTREAILGYLEAAGKAGIPDPRSSGPEPSIVELEVSLP